MNELSTFGYCEKTVTTKELAETLGVDKTTVTKTVKRLEQGGDVLHHLTTDEYKNTVWCFTEKQATIIKQEIQKHHNLATRQIDSVTTEYEENQTILNALTILKNRADEYKKRMEAAESVVNRIADSSGLKSIKEVADILGYGEKTYFAMLRGMGILFKDNGINLPKREYINSKYFEVKEEPYKKDGRTYLYSRIYVTAKGLLWLEKKTPSVKESQYD